MGNAAITIHHPNCLDHGVPYLESGKIIDSNNSMIRFEKRDGAAVGCGGRVTFKNTLASSELTFRVVKENTNTTGLSVEAEVTIDAESQKEAESKLSVNFGITTRELAESTTLIRSRISNQNKYSELHVYVDFNGKKNGTVRWTKNDLGMKFEKRWAEDSEMIIDVKFLSLHCCEMVLVGYGYCCRAHT